MARKRPTAQSSLERALIVVRTYPSPSRKDIEVSCTAGVTEDGNWIRLFPVPYRFMDEDKRFRKYQEIECRVIKASDPRPESHNVDVDSIRILGEPITTSGGWAQRRARLETVFKCCMCCISKQRDMNGSPTLGFFKPARIESLKIKETNDSWSEDELAKLRQIPLWRDAPSSELQKIPFDFKYHYFCPHDYCPGHTQGCTDWEVGESFRQWRVKYGDEWEPKFRQTFEDEMMSVNDTHFYVGTLSRYPSRWQVVGLWYPRLADVQRPRQLELPRLGQSLT